MPKSQLQPLSIFVVGGTEQSGKTTVAARCAAILGTAAISSSVMLNPLVEKRLRLPSGTIALARARDHNAYRADLIAETDRLSAREESAGLLCLRAGYRVIDGLRRASEVKQCRAAARKRGWRPLVLFLERSGRGAATDNTETAALRRLADAVISNDGGLDHLMSKTDAVLRRFLSPAA